MDRHLSKVSLLSDSDELTDNQKQHLERCARCSELNELFQHAKSQAGNATDKLREEHFSVQEVDETVDRLYDRDIASHEAAYLVNHLRGCSGCFQLFENVFHEALKDSDTDSTSHPQCSVSLAELVLKEAPAAESQPVRERFRRFFHQRQPIAVNMRQILSWAAAFVGVVVISRVGLVFYHNTDAYQLGYAEELLQENHVLYNSSVARASDLYKSTDKHFLPSAEHEEMFSETRAKSAIPDLAGDPPLYLMKAYERVVAVYKRDTTRVKPRRLLAEILVLNEQYGEARTLLDNITDAGTEAARAYNVRASANYHLEDYESALDDVERTLNLDPDYLPAQYNQVLTLDALGKKEQAAIKVNAYLENEQDESWRAAAEKLQARLNN